jgi:histidinol phosphatase-like enzyme (inositol monophosphatase family)
MQSCPQHLIAFAHRLADAAAEVHRREFRRPLGAELKPDGSPVTVVDRQAEEAVRRLVRTHFPAHGVIGEELEPERPDADYVWVVDPLDGTRLYLLGIPQFAVLIGLAHRGRFILGLIDQPVLRDRWLGADGHGTTFNGEPVRTRPCASLAEAVVCRPGLEDNTLGYDAAMDAVSGRAAWTHWGVTPYVWGLLASGYLDLIVTAGPKLHDLAPLDPIIRNAGGAVCDWVGRPIDLSSRDHVVAAGDASLIGQVLPQLAI